MNDTSYKRYTVKFNSEDIPLLYSEWQWLVNPEDIKDALLMTSFGDLFFEKADGTIHFLDTLEGIVSYFASDEKELEAKLADSETQNRYLSSQATDFLRKQNLVVKDYELYIYVPHPIVTGSVKLDSVQIMSMNVVISLSGQFLRQVRH